MRNKILILGFILSNLISSCSNGQIDVPVGNLRDKQAIIEYAIYYSDISKIDKDKIVELIRENYPEIEIIDSIPLPDEVSGSQIVINEFNNVKEDFPVADMESLKYFSQGLSDIQKAELQNSNYVIILDFFAETNELKTTLEKANNLMIELVLNQDAIIYDSETREYFSKKYWVENRLIRNGEIDISKHITIHLYQKNDYCRAITLGMLKFGLPEICIKNLSCHTGESIANLINLSAQTIFEQSIIHKKGKLNLDIDLIENKELRVRLLNSLDSNAMKKSIINIVQGKWEEGDPNNKIIEFAFSKNNPQVEHDELLSEIFGALDEVSFIEHDDELLEASEQAKKRIPALKEMFIKGMPPGQNLLVKFPFKNFSGESEWMWVEVVKWKGDKVFGLLQNEPKFVTSLKAGEEVKKNINEMFDYILYFPDGTQEETKLVKL